MRTSFARLLLYDVTLRVEGPDGHATKTKNGFITLYRRVRVDEVTSSSATGLVPHEITFKSAVSGPPVEYGWDFGDGKTGNGETVTHTYTTAGTFTVTLTATGALRSNTATGTTSVVLQEPVVVPALLGKSLKEARLLLAKAGLKVGSVTNPQRYEPITKAQKTLHATPRNFTRWKDEKVTDYSKIRPFGFGTKTIRVPYQALNPAWAPANAALQRLKGLYDRELKAGVWTVASDSSPADRRVTPGTTVNLVCR